jgi:signal transduction histidine kinase
MGVQTPAKGRLALRWRLTIWIALAFSFAVGAVFLVVWLAVSQILENDITDGLDSDYQSVLGRVILSEPPEYDALVQSFPFPVVIYDPQGSVIAANDSADIGAMQVTEADVLLVTVERGAAENAAEIRGESFRVRAGGLRTDTEVLGIVQVGRSTETVEEVRAAIILILVVGGLGSLLAVCVVGYWLARSALLPVDWIARTAGEIEASDLTRRIGAQKEPAEIQRLADTFDGMLARLESAFAQQRNFVMDVSHELRTPLTGLRGNIDVMLMDPGLDTEARSQLETMSAEVSRLIRLTSNLLYLAHAEAGREIAKRPVDINDLCLEVIHQEQNVRAGVSIRLTHDEQFGVLGDRDLLKQLLLNIVDNAVRFSPEGGQVSVALAHNNGCVEIRIGDQGPGIPPDQLESIFQRFYQGSQAGSRSSGGAGIGLAISRWIARAHGGEITAENRDGAGGMFVVSLPETPSRPSLEA